MFSFVAKEKNGRKEKRKILLTQPNPIDLAQLDLAFQHRHSRPISDTNQTIDKRGRRGSTENSLSESHRFHRIDAISSTRTLDQPNQTKQSSLTTHSSSNQPKAKSNNWSLESHALIHSHMQAHISTPLPYMGGVGVGVGSSTPSSYYPPLPQHSQPQSAQQSPASYNMQQHMMPPMQQQQRMGNLGNGAIIGSNAHYSLVQQSPQQSPYRTPGNGTPAMSPSQHSNLAHGMLAHHPSQGVGSSSPYYSPHGFNGPNPRTMVPPGVGAGVGVGGVGVGLGGNLPNPLNRPTFARELFPHEMNGLVGGGIGGLQQPQPQPLSRPQLKDSSPSPNPEEYSQHEKNVRSITESPPPEQIVSMLSQILAPEVGQKLTQSNHLGHSNGGGHSVPSATGGGQRTNLPPPPQGMTPHQQQLYMHFHKSQPILPPTGANNNNNTSSNSSNLMSPYANSTGGLPSTNFCGMRPPFQPSYYDHLATNSNVGGSNNFNSSLAYNTSTSTSASTPPNHLIANPNPSLYGTPSHHQPPQQPSLAGMIDSNYYAQIKLRQQQQQQQHQQQQYHPSQPQPPQHAHSNPTRPFDSYVHPPPPLQSRSQSLPEYTPHAHSQSSFPEDGYDPNTTPLAGSGMSGLDFFHTLHQQGFTGAAATLTPTPNPQTSPSSTSASHSLPPPPPGLSAPPGFTKSTPNASPMGSPSTNATNTNASTDHVKSSTRDDASRRPPVSSPQSGPPARAPLSQPPYPRRTQSLGDPNNPSTSQEAVHVSLSRVGRADVSRFSAGPPNPESKGFGARCCTEALRGRAHGTHANSSVLSRMASSTGRRGSKTDSTYIPLSNPYGQLQSSPDLPNEAESDLPASHSNLTSPNQSKQSTPGTSPIKQPRARMASPLLPPK